MSATTRLTPAQRDALLLVADGGVVRGQTQWYRAGSPRALRSRPYEALWHAGLIELAHSRDAHGAKAAFLSARGADVVTGIRKGSGA